MGKWSVILGAFVLLFSVGFVRADMAGASHPDADNLRSGIALQAEIDNQLPGQASACESVLLGSLDIMLPSADDSADTKQQRSDVRVLPGGPSSVALFLSALTGLGAWRLGRSARSFNLASVPDWYHTGGSIQVGHITALNPDLTAPATISICDLLTEQSIRFLLRRAAPLRHSQCPLPALAAPRAPPFC
jgi:hypothetical protein